MRIFIKHIYFHLLCSAFILGRWLRKIFARRVDTLTTPLLCPVVKTDKV